MMRWNSLLVAAKKARTSKVKRKKTRGLFEALERREVMAAFTPGNLVVYRVGDGAGSLVNTGSPVFLDEYTPTGTLAQSIALPTTASGANKRLVSSGTATSEGLLSLSADGRYLVLTGYDAPLPTTGLAGTTSAAVNRVVGRVDQSGTVDTSTALADFATGNNPRSVASTNGTDLWVDGGAGGIRYATFGGSTSTQLSSTVTNLRQAAIFGGQLYVSTSSGTSVRIGAVGSGLPTTAGQTIANLPGIPAAAGSPFGFYLADLEASVAGVDTLYVADDSAGLLKYSLVGANWVANGSVGAAADAYRGLTASVSGNTVTLYATRKGGSGATGGGEFVRVVDATGYNGTIAATPTLLAAAATNMAFRGIAFAPASDLTISQSTSPDPVTVGGALTYSLTVANVGTTNASAVTVQYALPSGANYSSAAGSSGFTANQSGAVVTFSGGNLAAGASTTLSVVVVPTAAGPLTSGVATVDPTNTIAEANEANNSAAAITTTVLSAPLVSIAATDSAASEAGSAAGVFRISRGGATTSSLAVNYAVAAGVGQATNGTDYAPALAGSVVIPAGQGFVDVTITPVDDAVLEGSETVTISLIDALPYDLGSPSTASVTIADNDAPTTIDLSSYMRVGRYDLPEPTRTAPPDATSLLAQEASAVTYDWDTDTLFVLGDGGTAIVQVTKTGQLVDSMTLAPGSSPQGTSFYDPEGLTYVGGGQFVFVEERYRQANLFTYVPGTTLTLSDVRTVKLGTTIGNVGIEGISYDPFSGGFIAVKEISPEGIFQTGIDFIAGTATNGSPTTVNSVDLFNPALVGTSDFADVFALSNIPFLSGQGDYDDILVLSQEEGKIVHVDRSGAIANFLVIASDPGNPLSIADQQQEGLTMDRDGVLYVVNENGGGDINHPQLWVYTRSAVPNQAPSALALANTVTSLPESTNTATRVRVADIVITDDGLGNNQLSVTGTDASAFEIVAGSLYLKAGTALSFATKPSYSVTVDVDDASVGGAPDASASFTLNITQVVNPGTLIVSEVAPWSSGNSPVAADWFEVTNTGAVAVNLAGWRVDDNSNSFAASVALNGVTSIAPGESVIFLETSSAATVSSFLSTWFGAAPPAGLQVGTYSGAGIGLSTTADAVNLYNSAGALQANVTFGAATVARTFDNSAGLNNAAVTSLSVVGIHGAIAAVNDPAEIGSPGSVGRLFVSEVAPWSSGSSPVAADWFEVTNTSAQTVNLAGWRVDDNSNSFAASVALNGVTSIAPGESVIFIETSSAATVASFRSTWFGAAPPAGLQIGTYSGSGIGLSTAGDAVNLYDSTGVLQANVSFGASPAGSSFPTFDNTAGLNNAVLSTLSATGVNGAFAAVNDTKEIGSPGQIAAINPFAPTIQENSATPYLRLAATGAGYLSGVMNDPTDPARTIGIDFTIADPDTPLANLTVTAVSGNPTVVSNGGLSLTGSGASRNLKITPTDVGYAPVTVTVSDGVSSVAYVLQYAASAASTTPGTTRFHVDSSDASAAIAVDASYMFVGDDEDQKLRLYNRQNSGLPVASFDYTTSLGLTDFSGGAPREVDIEAAARSGNRIFWVGSESNASSGAARPNRNRIFATDVSGAGAGATLSYVGRYDYLKDDLIAWDQNNGNVLGFAASAATGIVPEAPDGSGFNIEGIVFKPGSASEAYLAFRAPLQSTSTRNGALLVPVTNFASLAASGGPQGSAQFGAPIQLDLGGRGVRDIVSNGTSIVIVAGPASSVGSFSLYTWTGLPSDAPVLRGADLTGLNPEAIVEVPANVTAATQLQLLSDNGDNVWYADNIIAKDLPHDEQTKFRSDLVTLGPANLRIHDVQGGGASSPYVGESVTVDAIVVGDFQNGDADNQRNLGGFYLQEENSDVDGNPLTSEAVFVFGGANVSVGDRVRVTGTVTEFFGLTEISSPVVTIVQAGAVSDVGTLAVDVDLPTVGVTLNQNGAYQPDLEGFEGMLVRFPEVLTISEQFNLDRFNEIKLSAGGRPENFTNANEPSAVDYDLFLRDVGSRKITYDDGLNVQNASIDNLDGFAPYGTGSAPRMGDTITNLTGVLDYQFSGVASASGSTWRVRSIANGSNHFAVTNPRTAAAEDVGGRLKVGSLNVLNYFKTLDTSSSAATAIGLQPRGANTLAEFERQTAKLVQTLLAIDPDVLGLTELENDFLPGSSGNALEHLVDQLNAVAGAGTYAWINPGSQFLGGDAIAVGFLYKPAHVQITTGTTIERLNDTDVAPALLAQSTVGHIFDGLNTSRNALAVSFTEVATNERFSAVINHLKSKSGTGTGADADQLDGQGNWQQQRELAVQALAAWVATDPTGSADRDYLLLGDFNAYLKEDALDILRGSGFANLAEDRLADPYSYVFDAAYGALDHAFASGTLNGQVTGVTEWHINADEADALDYNLDFGRNAAIFDAEIIARESDHDPVLVGLALHGRPVATDGALNTNEDVATTGTLIANDLDSPQLTYLLVDTSDAHGTVAILNDALGSFSYTPAPNFSGVASFKFQVDDGALTSDVATVTITVRPVADAPSLSVSATAGTEGAATPLSISAGLTDTDGSEALSIRIEGVPASVTLSAGAAQGAGVWLLTPTQLAGLTILSVDQIDVTLLVTATATEAANGDAASTSATLAVSIANVAPTITSLANSSSTCCGAALMGVTPVTINATFSDAGLLDSHVATIDWGDGVITSGSVAEVPGSGAGSVAASHVYATGGYFTITVTVADQDGGSHARTTDAVVSGYVLTPAGQLLVIGTSGRDTVSLSRTFSNTLVLNAQFGLSHSHRDRDHDDCDDQHDEHDEHDDEHDSERASVRVTFPVGRVTSVVMLGCAGDDVLFVSDGITVPVSLDGGAGDDSLWGGSGPDVMVDLFGDNFIRSRGGDDTVTTGDGDDDIETGAGRDLIFAGGGADKVSAGAGDDIVSGGAGDDEIDGGDGRDLLIGGSGADRIRGSRHDDVLVAGYTIYDQDAAALRSLLAEWSSAGAYAVRVDNLRSGGGLASGVKLIGDHGATQTVFTDDDVDRLDGDLDRDLYFANLVADNGGPLDIIKSERNESKYDSDR